MKVTILTTSLSGGGAAIAAKRHYESLRAIGVDVRMIALKGDVVKDPHIEVLSDRCANRYRGQVARLVERADIAMRLLPSHLKYLWRFSSAHWGLRLTHHPWVREADIIHLHWVNHGLLSLSALEDILVLDKPVVWTLHDLWATTGGCHLPLLMSPKGAELCPRYAEGCGACPLLTLRYSAEQWTRRQKECKQRLFTEYPNLHFVAVSSLVARLVAPHLPVPPAIISPSLPQGACGALELEAVCQHESIRYIVVVAARLDDEVKGPMLLYSVMENLMRKIPSYLASQVCLRLVGEIRDPRVFASLPIQTELVGSLTSDQLRGYYSQARVVLSASLFETFGQTLSEALAQGAPVVSFDTVGVADLIRPEIDGQIVPSYNTEAMADALLSYLIPDSAALSERRERAQRFRDLLSPEYTASAHLDLYDKLLSPL